MNKKNVWILSFSELHKDPRVFRQIQWLAPHYHVTTFGFSPSGIEGVRHIPIEPPLPGSPWYRLDKWPSKIRACLHLFFKKYEKFYWARPFHRKAMASIKNIEETPDLMIANDIYTMPIALKAAKNSPVLLDLHEYAPREWEDIIKWRIIFQPYVKYLTKEYLPKASASFTVCKGIADEYKKQFGVEPLILTNAPNYKDLHPSPLEDGKIRMIHHGAAIPSRRLEEMIHLMDYLDERFHLDFMLVAAENTYVNKLRSLAKKNPKIRFLPPVPMQEIATFSNNYDIGLFYLIPVNFNYLHGLPNKFFEYIQARLAIAIGPSPEMANYINKYKCGIVADQFNIKNLAMQLNKLTPETLSFYKSNAHQGAQDLNAENNSQIVLKTIRNHYEI